ncbi:Guanine nucleotide-binding protein G(I)/G(S)/G(O) subunit gamma-2 [Trichoplax sp. H2]|uniref:Guanine nucleotide-binding protein subunit gamma n=1 Tax=Trichoplax adhaerens TaxID=10228 RepID=A0A3Q8RVG5_TRIAD|nr:G protein gamma subunit 3 [Trichoplax adhaerens]RDD39923.1 Guanine nucleotide-binding protein G(I)/G(S)/G(O) subunit gamma-2 [Trichoplax sp. H2]|eukprot:RDD39923.1 Guanine nucleotide-binding protein G(I)/G(S)/G(O) subunit gamma-2 [Trichoplax sp. H2]
MPASISNEHKIDDAKKMIEQLKREFNINRISIATASNNIKKYCEKEACNDPMLNKIPPSSNPFRERKKVCNLI